MCGIFALLNNDNEFSASFIQQQFELGKNRGPEFSILKKPAVKTDFGFHRLAINGLNKESNQPIEIDNLTLICNGEIYNYKELYEMMNIIPVTDSDCEVIIHLYRRYGIDHTLQMLDGVFAFVLLDTRLENPTNQLYVSRDPYGVRPLYILKPNSLSNNKNNIFAFASELKILAPMKPKHCSKWKNITRMSFFNETPEEHIYSIQQFEPGTYSLFELTTQVSASWKPVIENKTYHATGFQSSMYISSSRDNEYILDNIQCALINAVRKRCMTTERPIACLLSGGLDSSLITALVQNYHTENNLPSIETYGIGLAGSVDLKYAKKVANYIGTKHTEIILTEDDFCEAIPDVIRSIESYDTTTVRASIGNWLIGKYISEHSEAKVIFNGDGSDELTGGYLYMGLAPDPIEFDKETRRLLKDIHTFDVLRSDKSISSHGLEPRTPFLDRSFVQNYLSIPPNIRNHRLNNQCEKWLLRTAFSRECYSIRKKRLILPDEIIWRPKEAFSDGVSKESRSLYEIIQDYVELLYPEDLEVYLRNKSWPDNHLLPTTKEQYHYRKIFEDAYPGQGSIIPYFWMPKYVDATDASARTLSIYKKSVSNDSLVYSDSSEDI